MSGPSRCHTSPRSNCRTAWNSPPAREQKLTHPAMTKRYFLRASAAGATVSMMPTPSQASSLSAKLPAGPSELELVGPWQFRQAGTGDWLPATVPGTVHTDLLANGKIADPFYR